MPICPAHSRKLAPPQRAPNSLAHNRRMLTTAEPCAEAPRPAVVSGRRTTLLRRNGAPVQILMVDDEDAVAQVVSVMLRYEGASVDTVGDADTALSAARCRRPDIAILDLGLPGMEGLALLRALREAQPELPVLLLSRAGEEPDRFARFAAGEESLPKPFSLEEVLLRVRKALRRAAIPCLNDRIEIQVGDLIINDDSREATRNGDPIPLSYREFEVLRFLACNAHRVVTRQQILARVWPYDFAGRLSVVELYISYLRKKVDVGRSPMLHTVRGSGYILKAAT